MKVSDGDDSIYVRRPAVWREWSGGCNGVLYRFLGAAIASEEWVASISISESPPIEERVRQEHLLFDFYVSALSSLDCLAYGLCAIGEFLRQAAFPVTTSPRDITFGLAASTFTREFPGDALAQQLSLVHNSREMADLRDVRNILTHRVVPARSFSEALTTTPTGGYSTQGATSWLGGTLGPHTTVRPRVWVARALTEILDAAQAFANRELTSESSK